MADGSYRNRISIEVKGGTDYSNIHNRLGEAEKTHQNAKAAGFTEFWTVITLKIYSNRFGNKRLQPRMNYSILGKLLIQDIRNILVLKSTLSLN